MRPVVAAIADKVMNRFVSPQLKLHFDYLEFELGQHDWFVGSSFGAADIQMSFPVEAGAARLGYRERPNLQRFLDAIHARPGYRRALEKGGPYDLLS
jgi:glutathione S-transferase